MKNLALRALLIVSSLILITCGSGCVSVYQLRAGELAPAQTNVAPEARVATWQRAVVVLIDQGYVPQVLNETAGYISAHRRDDFVNDALSGTTALVTISPEGLVRVVLAGLGTFGSEQDFIRAMSDRQSLLLKLITSPVGTPTVPREP